MRKLRLVRGWVKKNRTLAIAITVSFIGLILLYAYAVSIKAVHRSVGDINENDIGNLVITEGYLKDLSFNQGGASLILTDIGNSRNITVFIPKNVWDGVTAADIIPGAKLQVQGVVDEYAGEIELTVGGSGSITVLEKAGKLDVRLDSLLRNPSLYSGMHITTNGSVTGVRVVVNPQNFQLADRVERDFRLWVEVSKNVSYRYRTSGDSVTVFGTLRYDEYGGGTGRWEISVNGSGDDVASTGSGGIAGYENCSMTDVVRHPEGYSGHRLALSGTVLNFSELVGTEFGLVFKSGAEYSLKCIVFGADMHGSGKLETGCEIRFTGKFAYYAPGGFWQLRAYSEESVIRI